ncbi:MAG: dicarboxylate/amino acid:cation symporter [Bacteroidales bacterium]|nr:dicarboxylate/amino acid:cation symporter [Bacteroidales bacterium]
MREKKFHLGLLPRIIIAIGSGIGAGYVFPEWTGRIFITFNATFSEFLGFCIPLIITGFVTIAIGEIGSRAGKMLVATALLAYVATFFAASLSYFTGLLTFPSLLGTTDVSSAIEAEGSALQPYFVINMPPVLDVMTALVLSFVLGLGIAMLDEKSALRRGFTELRLIIVKVIENVIIPLLPLYIFGIFLNMTVAGEVGPILATFVKIIAVIFGIHIVVLLIQFSVAAIFSRGSKNPLKLLGTMLPAYFTALGTQSSAATIPVTLGQAIKLGVNKDVAGFVVPLCANIHMSGSALKITACALALMMTQGMPFDTPMFMGFIAMLGVTMVASPGVPGGSIMASLGILSSILGFTDADNALMIALYIAMDSFGTACNVTGDGALSVIIDRFFGKKQ